MPLRFALVSRSYSSVLMLGKRKYSSFLSRAGVSRWSTQGPADEVFVPTRLQCFYAWPCRPMSPIESISTGETQCKRRHSLCTEPVTTRERQPTRLSPLSCLYPPPNASHVADILCSEAPFEIPLLERDHEDPHDDQHRKQQHNRPPAVHEQAERSGQRR
jgi:hypothetical protein